MNKRIIFAFGVVSIMTSFLFAKERPIVSDINAVPGKGTAINISWKLPVNPEKKVQMFYVYRSSSPIGTYYDISNAFLIAKVDSVTAGFIDNVKNYNDYYYAVIAQVDGQKYDIILPSINSTVNGVHLKFPERTEEYYETASAKEKLIGPDEMRDTPLPFINFSDVAIRKKMPFSLEVQNAAKSLTGDRKFKKQKLLEIYVFEEDLISPESGDDYLLFDILKNTFIQKKYSEACTQLESLLRTNCSLKVQHRATFYLAESQYYSRRYKDAVRTFLHIYEIYPSLTKKWVDSSLDLLKVEY